jgi:beta-mannosidase
MADQRIMSTRSLDGSWQFRCPHALRGAAPRNPSLRKWMPAKMPGTVHFHLQKLGKIPDPYDARNELDVQWIDEQDWELRRTVRASAADCLRSRQELVFDGLDTVATVSLNGRVVGRSANMFRQVVCDVAGVLAPGNNELRVLLRSPTAYAAREARRGRAPSVKSSDFVWQTGERRATHREWIRKTQCHFGWDWGLYLATSGVWRPARLECSDAPRIASVKTRQTHRATSRGRTVELEVTAHLVTPVATRGTLSATSAGAGATVDVRLRPGENRVVARFIVADPDLWWPAGEGEPALYDLDVTFRDRGGASESLGRRIGFRSLELVTRADGPSSETFFFRVNGRDVYARGANWIPVDQLVDRARPAVYRHLLQSMVEANMNMVRVWGGGWYELDTFYDLCDELGILVWQDFMMACALYPDSRPFLAELAAEAKYQVRRLHDHPSLALWCGDNENEVAVHKWRAPGADQKRAAAAYARTSRALRKACEAEDTTRRFWHSSPSNGVLDAEPTDPNRGDVHYWNVWHGRRPFSDYLSVKPRFASEFGFQSFPEPRTIRAVVPRTDVNPSSRVMEHHQRSPEGNLLITSAMAREMPIPKDFDSFCWMSQINQAMAMRTAVEHWRRLKPWCMGALYWQLADLWPVASWSSIDYHGRWKVLHHAASRFFAPLLASIVTGEDHVEVWATSDLAEPVTLRGELDAVAWSGRLVGRVRLRARLRAGESRRLARVPLERLLRDSAEPHEACCFVRLSGAGRAADNFGALVPWKWAHLPKPSVDAKLRATRSGLELAVRTSAVTPFFHAELAGLEGHFRGDWQVLRPGRVYRMPWVSHFDRGESATRAKLRRLSLYDLNEH